MEIPGQLPVIAGRQDSSLMLEDLVEAICIIKLHAPIGFKYKFYENNKIAICPLWGIEYESQD